MKSNNNNFRLQKESIRKPTVNNRGYFSIRLCKNGKYKAQFIHRLVAIAFIDNPNNLPEVNHKIFKLEKLSLFSVSTVRNGLR